MEPYQTGTVPYVAWTAKDSNVGAYPSKGAPYGATLKSLQAERELISSHVDALHEEMMRLPRNQRRDRWEEYYRLLDGLARHQQKLEKAIESVHADHK